MIKAQVGVWNMNLTSHTSSCFIYPPTWTPPLIHIYSKLHTQLCIVETFSTLIIPESASSVESSTILSNLYARIHNTKISRKHRYFRPDFTNRSLIEFPFNLDWLSDLSFNFNVRNVSPNLSQHGAADEPRSTLLTTDWVWNNVGASLSSNKNTNPIMFYNHCEVSSSD